MEPPSNFQLEIGHLRIRLMECLEFRIKDIDFERFEVVVRDGKGGKDRITMLPTEIAPALHEHIERVRNVHERDLQDGAGQV